MDPTLNALFGTQQSKEKATQIPSGQPELGQARTQLEDVEKTIQQGDWEKFGKAMAALKHLLTEPRR